MQIFTSNIGLRQQIRTEIRDLNFKQHELTPQSTQAKMLFVYKLFLKSHSFSLLNLFQLGIEYSNKNRKKAASGCSLVFFDFSRIFRFYLVVYLLVF